MVLRRRERGEEREGGGGLVRGPHGRKGALLELAVRAKALAPGLAAVRERHERALVELALAEADPRVALDDLEGLASRGEEGLAPAEADPERASDAAGDEDDVGAALVEPGGRHRAA